jgi:transposase
MSITNGQQKMWTWGELLIPLVAVMRQELISGSYIQADETPVDVQMHEGRGRNHQANLWQYGRPAGTVVFDFRLGRGRDGPRQFLGQFEGILQTDGYAAYDQIGGPRMVHAACWAEAQHKGMNFAARDMRRQEGAKPLVQKIRRQIDAAHCIALPSSALSKACQYALTLWKKLTRFLEYPELELSNNLAKNSMRSVALGRKNWIHIGSPQAGPKVAAILSVVESCRRLKLSVRDYLSAILPGLADVRIQTLPELTPSARAY